MTPLEGNRRATSADEQEEKARQAPTANHPGPSYPSALKKVSPRGCLARPEPRDAIGRRDGDGAASGGGYVQRATAACEPGISDAGGGARRGANGGGGVMGWNSGRPAGSLRFSSVHRQMSEDQSVNFKPGLETKKLGGCSFRSVSSRQKSHATVAITGKPAQLTPSLLSLPAPSSRRSTRMPDNRRCCCIDISSKRR